MLTRFHVDKTDILLVRRLTPFSVAHLIAVSNIEVITHIDAFEQDVEGTLVVRQFQFAVFHLSAHLFSLQRLLVSRADDTHDDQLGLIVDRLHLLWMNDESTSGGTKDDIAVGQVLGSTT